MEENNIGQVPHGSATTTFAGKAAIQPENSRNKRERYGGQIKGYLSICGKEQSVRKDWYFSI